MSDDDFVENFSDTMDEDEQEEDDFYDEDSSMGDDHGEDIFDTGDDSGFGPIIPDKQRKRPYEVDFKVYSIDDIVKSQEKEVEKVSNILGVERQHAATLLRHMRWNSERLLEKYMDNRELILQNAGVIMDSNSAPKYIKAMFINAKKKRGENDFMCEICCDDDPELDTLALSCQHRFCSNCYTHYLTQKIREEGESRRIQCPQDGCKVIVDEKTIKLVVDSSTNDKYRTLLNRTYVDDNDFLRWCPAPSCEYAIECHVLQTDLATIVPTVTCTCGHRFCFGCGYSDHQPSICVLVKKWLKKCEDDSETANWISAHTKECPQCISTIEKNGGCNHLTCRKCKHEFCWVCLGPWSEHGTSWYNCNRYDEKSSSEARDAQAKSRASLERYLHYYNRFTNHDQSAKLDKEVYLRTEAKMQEMQETSDLSWIQVQFLRQAVDILMQARATLKWTYAFAFYLAKGNMTEIFEDNQRDLEMATENLSEMLERPIEKEKIAELRQEVLNKMGYVEKRREVVLEDTAKGLIEGRWSYFIDLK